MGLERWANRLCMLALRWGLKKTGVHEKEDYGGGFLRGDVHRLEFPCSIGVARVTGKQSGEGKIIGAIKKINDASDWPRKKGNG